jgi:voltage-gated potassium channel
MAPDSDDELPMAAPVALTLTRHQRRVLLARSIARVVAITVLLLVAYFAAPIGQDADAAALVLLSIGLVGFIGLTIYQVRRILDSPMPQLRAAETLATVVPLVIVVFALFYVGMSATDPGSFSEPVTKVNGLYFTVTVLSTVGFGDITAQTDGPRIAVTVQMLVDLLIVGVLVKVIIGASRIAVERRRVESEGRQQNVEDGTS